MKTFHEIAKVIGQVRSEMRFVLAKEMPITALAAANAHLCRLDESIRQFKYRLPIEQRREPDVQQLIRDLHRLHEDLLHFYGTVERQVTHSDSERMVLSPVDTLTYLLIRKIS